MDASILLEACEKAGIDFFSGVPDSQLKGLCNELYSRYGTASDRHVVAHNEGGAMALCAGHYLATGHPGLCYMQNSGLGNTVNPLASLMDEEVYGLPCLLVIGWRGEPGVKDEPQHVKQGQITLGQLDLMGVPWFVLDADMTESDFRAHFAESLKVLAQGKCAAIVVRKGALTTHSKPDYSNEATMKRETAAEILLEAAGSEAVIVSTTGKLSREVFEIRERRGEGHGQDFLTVGSMGHASMIAMAMANDLPGKKIWCLDGDGAALMHLGTLAVIGRRKPSNMVHVVINNGAHETVGGMPVCNRELPVAELARAAGYDRVYTAETEPELREKLRAVVEDNHLCMVEIRCACGARDDLGRPTTTPKQNRDALMEFVKK